MRPPSVQRTLLNKSSFGRIPCTRRHQGREKPQAREPAATQHAAELCEITVLSRAAFASMLHICWREIKDISALGKDGRRIPGSNHTAAPVQVLM